MKNVLIIGTYPNENHKVILLEKCLEKVRPLGFDIILVSHFSVSEKIQEMVDYYFYEKNNILTPTNLTPEWTFNNQSFSLRKKNFGHVLAVSNNIINGIKLSKNLGYENFIYMEYDNLFEFSDLLKMKYSLESMSTMKKKMLFFKNFVEGNEVYETLIFGGNVDYFYENNFLPSQPIDLEGESVSLERLFFTKQKKNENLFYVIDSSTKTFFSNSEINLEFRKYLIEIFPSNKFSEFYIFCFNQSNSKIILNSNFLENKELSPNCWYLLKIDINQKIEIEIESEGVIRQHHFHLSPDELMNLTDKGFIHFN
jgi:hypothetical protein